MAVFGKEKCEYLRDVRVKIAEANGIYYTPAECQHEGECPGFCPVCDKEMEYITQQLEEKVCRGEPVKLSGLLVDDTKMANYSSGSMDKGGIGSMDDGAIEDFDAPSRQYSPVEPEDISLGGIVQMPEEIERERYRRKPIKHSIPTKGISYSIKIKENSKFINLPSSDSTNISIPLRKFIRLFAVGVVNTLVVDNLIVYESRRGIRPYAGSAYVYSIQMSDTEVILLAKTKSVNVVGLTNKNLMQIVDKKVDLLFDREYIENPDIEPQRIYVKDGMTLQVSVLHK